MKATPRFSFGILAVMMSVAVLLPSGVTQSMTLIDQSYTGRHLRTEVQAANVNIVTHAEPSIHVLAVQRGGQSGDFSVSISEEDGTVVIRDQARPRLGNANLVYTISVPEETGVELHVLSGNTSIEGLRAAASIDARSGNITVRQHQGSVEVRLSSGNVEIERSRLSLAVVRSGSGNIRVRESSGPLTLHSNSGNITVENAQEGAVQLSGNSGNIELSGRLPEGSQSSIRQGSGNVTVRLPSGSNLQLEANTVSGNVSSSLELVDSSASRTSLSGSLGSGSASLTIVLTSGNIRLEPF